MNLNEYWCRKYRLRHIIKTIRPKYFKQGDNGYEYSLKKNDEIALAKIKRIKKQLDDEGVENFNLIAENNSEDMITKGFGGRVGIFNKNRYGGGI